MAAEILAKEDIPQPRCPLFKIPGEVRNEIFALALADYPDAEKQYAKDTCYSRPAYFAPRRTDTQVLRTCRNIYRETWHMPLILKEQVHWLTGPDRHPNGYNQARALRQLGHALKANGDREIHILRIFAQMYKLEEGKFGYLLENKCLCPQVVCLTIRHADWWYWEQDEPLHFDGAWVMRTTLPDSVRELQVELETQMRRKDQLEMIATEMMAKWFFKRSDGACLFAESATAATWRGSSTWHRQRWIRDESEEGVIDYHVITVAFRLEQVFERQGKTVSAAAKANSEMRGLSGHMLKLEVKNAKVLDFPGPTYIDVDDDGLYSSCGHDNDDTSNDSEYEEYYSEGYEDEDDEDEAAEDTDGDNEEEQANESG